MRKDSDRYKVAKCIQAEPVFCGFGRSAHSKVISVSVLSDVAGKLLGERAFEHGGQGLSEMADWLLSFAAGKAEQVGVAIETPRGPVVESLMERGFAVHAINPKQLDRFRDRISPAGAKDDRRDARVLASALRTDPHCLRRLEPTDPVIVELREWSRLSEEMTRERVRQANRMREQLWRYYPQLLAATSDDVAAPADAGCGAARSRSDADQVIETAPHPPGRRRDAV